MERKTTVIIEFIGARIKHMILKVGEGISIKLFVNPKRAKPLRDMLTDIMEDSDKTKTARSKVREAIEEVDRDPDNL